VRLARAGRDLQKFFGSFFQKRTASLLSFADGQGVVKMFGAGQFNSDVKLIRLFFPQDT
jgi:hypothetical protein